MVAALVDLYTGPLFRAALQLWVAASNEEQLRPRVTALEARVGRETHRIAVELLGADESRPGVRETVQGLLDMARGLGLANLLTDDTARRERVVAQWARHRRGGAEAVTGGRVRPRSAPSTPAFTFIDTDADTDVGTRGCFHARTDVALPVRGRIEAGARSIDGLPRHF